MLPKSSCGKIDVHTTLFWSWTQVVTFWLCSIVFTLYDKYNEMNGMLSIRKVYNPGRRPLTKVQWNMVRLANRESFKNTVFSVICQFVLYMPLYEWRGVCNNMWFENFNSIYDWLWLFAKLASISYVADAIFYFGMFFFVGFD